MYQVSIIGAGQLGSRHLQGLKGAASPLAITVMDSSKDSLQVSKERYEAVSTVGEKTVEYVSSIQELPKELDLVIIATGAKPRASIVKNLLNHSTVKYLILEKVLFTQLPDYDEIGLLLKANNVICWVNCPRRAYGSYSLIKTNLDYTKPVKMEYIGKDWGLCCNSMHLIDVFMFLTNEDSYEINAEGIEQKIFESKRPGYIEMEGTLIIKTKQGNELVLTSQSDCDRYCRVEVKNGFNYYALDEVKGILTIEGKEIKVDTPFQSQTTGVMADIILRTGYCPLSSYEKSATYHKIYIKTMLEKYNEITGENATLLPIT